MQELQRRRHCKGQDFLLSARWGLGILTLGTNNSGLISTSLGLKDVGLDSIGIGGPSKFAGKLGCIQDGSWGICVDTHMCKRVGTRLEVEKLETVLVQAAIIKYHRPVA